MTARIILTTEEKTAKRKAREKKWYAKNREKRLQQAREYAAKNKELIAVKKREYYEKNKDKLRAIANQKYIDNGRRGHSERTCMSREERRISHRLKCKKYRDNNPKKVLSSRIRWRRDNKEKLALLGKLYRLNNPFMGAIYTRNRRARIKRSDGSHTKAEISEIRKKQRDRCVYCMARLQGRGDVDHIYPISKNGANHKYNLQLLCSTCNRRKNAKDPIEYAQSLGLLI